MSSKNQSTAKRSPSILVTDVRQGHKSAPFVRKPGPGGQQSQNGRFNEISIDNILSDVSEIPSAQRRAAPTNILPRGRRDPQRRRGGDGNSLDVEAYGADSNVVTDGNNTKGKGRLIGAGGRRANTSGDNHYGTPTPASSSLPFRSSRSVSKQRSVSGYASSKHMSGDGRSNTGSSPSSMQQQHQQHQRAPLLQRRNSLPPRMAPTIPSRTTKMSERLVLIPEDDSPEFKFRDQDYDTEEGPPKDDEDAEAVQAFPRMSYAERVPKEKRTEKFPRVTAYCISDAVRLKNAAEYLRSQHKIKPRIYDEALFAPYYLPLLPGDTDSHSRVKSSPGGIQLLETLINRSEQVDHHYEYYSGLESASNEVEISATAHDDENEEFDPSEPQDFTPPDKQGADLMEQHHHNNENEATTDTTYDLSTTHPEGTDSTIADSRPANGHRNEKRNHDDDHRVNQVEDTQIEFKTDTTDNREHSHPEEAAHNSSHKPADDLRHAEIFIFSYGVIVFWNFTEKQEKDVLADLTFGRGKDGKPLVVRPIDDQDIETEELHFTYSPETRKPRIYNDMITLKSGDHMIKLAMSHAIAQSTKLSRFEARMDVNMHDVKHVPKMLALTGQLGMQRPEILKMSGKLFKLRVDVNLSSNVLDTPDFFWEAEPSLNPMYSALREYLEIEQRILVINERCKTFLELTDIIADSIAETNMSRITWVIIILIALSLGVSTIEILIRFAILKENVRG